MSIEICCYECEKLLRKDGVDIEEMHTRRDGEDVCEGCCDVCANDDEKSVHVCTYLTPEGRRMPRVTA